MSDPDEILRKLTVHDDVFIEEVLGGTLSTSSPALDPKTVALARLAALIAMGGSIPAYLSCVEAATLVGGKCQEIVELLLVVTPDVGRSRAIAAASAICGALGLDVLSN